MLAHTDRFLGRRPASEVTSGMTCRCASRGSTVRGCFHGAYLCHGFDNFLLWLGDMWSTYDVLRQCIGTPCEINNNGT